MIIPYDDYPCHQIGATFDQAGTSDIRFFDRYWFSILAPEQDLGLIAGLGVYKNTDVLDGFVSAALGGRQTNLRVSRQLRPDWTNLSAGPLQLEILEPMKRHRLELAPTDHGLACSLLLEAAGEPFDGGHFVDYDRGWAEKDYLRIFQNAKATGWIEVDGRRFESGPVGWKAARDRSFGVRPGMGGPLPSRGGKDLASGLGAREALYIGSLFETATYYGTWTISEGHDGRLLYLKSDIYDRAGNLSRFSQVSHDLHFAPGSLAFTGGRLVMSDEAGRERIIEIKPFASYVYQGFGYIDGWADKRGLGAWRGKLAVEGDRYNLTRQADIIDESGGHVFGRHGMLHSQFTMTLDGEPGHGEGIVFLMPQHERYGSVV